MDWSFLLWVNCQPEATKQNFKVLKCFYHILWSLVFGLRSHLCCQVCLATATAAAAGAEVPAANCWVLQNLHVMFLPWVNFKSWWIFLCYLKGLWSWGKKMEQNVFHKQFLKERAYRKPPILEHTLVKKTWFLQYPCCSKLFLPPSLDLHSPWAFRQMCEERVLCWVKQRPSLISHIVKPWCVISEHCWFFATPDQRPKTCSSSVVPIVWVIQCGCHLVEVFFLCLCHCWADTSGRGKSINQIHMAPRQHAQWGLLQVGVSHVSFHTAHHIFGRCFVSWPEPWMVGCSCLLFTCKVHEKFVSETVWGFNALPGGPAAVLCHTKGFQPFCEFSNASHFLDMELLVILAERRAQNCLHVLLQILDCFIAVSTNHLRDQKRKHLVHILMGVANHEEIQGHCMK